jgi:hypothetical protein
MWFRHLAAQIHLAANTDTEREIKSQRWPKSVPIAGHPLCLAASLVISFCSGLAQQPEVGVTLQNATPAALSGIAGATGEGNASLHPQAREELKITYAHEMLGIVAHGCRFADVLNAIGRQTGVSVEFPSGSAEERIFFESGPAPIRDVLQSLLDGAEFNYVILWSKTDTKQLARIVLSHRTRATSTTAGLTASPPPANEPSTEPALYGGGFGGDENEPVISTPVSQPDTSSFGSSDQVSKRAATENKTPGQVLEEMQKELIQQLDAQAAKSNQR